MNRPDFMQLACAALLCSKRCYGEVESAFVIANRLGAKLDTFNFFSEEAPKNADFVITTAITFIAADGGHWGDESVAISKAIGMWNHIQNPKKPVAQMGANGQQLAISNPENLPVYGPGGRLQISGIPQMPDWPSGSASATQGVLGDSAISHRSG